MLKTTKTTKCIKCGTKTTCKEGVCALCKSGITEIHNDLKELLGLHNDSNSQLKGDVHGRN